MDRLGVVPGIGRGACIGPRGQFGSRERGLDISYVKEAFDFDVEPAED